MKKYIPLFAVSIENMINIKKSYFLEKTLVLFTICSYCKNEDEKLFKEEESIKMLKICNLMGNI